MSDHDLISGGGVLQSKLDREAATEFLLRMESKTGWSMTKLIQSLKEQWDEDSEKE
jgi:hypothetical protein